MHVFPAFIASLFIIASPAPMAMPGSSAMPAASPMASPAATATPKAKPSASPTPKTPYDAMQWREIGPAASGGRVAAVAGSATDPNLYYFGAAGGGVWQSTNGGVTWSSVFNDQEVQSIGAIAIAPSDDKTVWVGTGEANPRNDVLLGTGAFKSTDAGGSWKKMGLADLQSISRILIDPANPDHVIVGGVGDFFKDSSAGGVWVTNDGGKTWSHTLYVGPSSGASDLAMDPNNHNVVYAGMWQIRREPWTMSSGGPDGGLYRSKDGGATWTKITGSGVPSLTGRIALAVAPSDPTRVYALIQSKVGWVFRSDDSGLTWKMMSDDTLADTRPFYFSHIAVDPKDKDRLYSVSFLMSVSKDGGKTFKPFSPDMHPDYHAIWIAPNDGKRIIVGQDGGTMVTVDGGQNWNFSRNYAIGQIYHVATDNRNPYWVCGGFQDNSGWCWPSNSLDSDGITNAYAYQAVGGDGEWVVPDPSNPNHIWADSEDGAVQVQYNENRQSLSVDPYLGDMNGFTYSKDKYRFDWDSPIAFAPWDPHTVWYGADVVFQTHDGGYHWTPISPDLTRDDKSKQVIPGGPINIDFSGAENYDTILDIEGSTIARGEIWVGTDDGLVQLTRDGGKHWTNVTPRGAPEWGRTEAITPSPFIDGTAFAAIDRHYSGDDAPYLYKTTDFGKTWTWIASGLPADQSARVIRQDPVNPSVLYAGLERSIWISFDGGHSWKTLQANLPHSSVFDIRIQEPFDDLIVGTHGRSAWIMDDIRPLQQLDKAKAAGQFVFQPRVTYQYATIEKEEGTYSEYGASNPPSGVMLYFYQTKAGKKPPTIDFLDASGHVLRSYSGSHPTGPDNKMVPWVKNAAGLNLFVWNMQETPIAAWTGAADKNARRSEFGLGVIPGKYTARVTFSNGKRISTPFVIAADPQTPWTQAQYEADYALGKSLIGMMDTINKKFNAIDSQVARLNKLGTPAAKAMAASGVALQGSLSANYKNGEDGIMYPPKFYEDLQGVVFGAAGANGPILDPLMYQVNKIKPMYAAAVTRIDAWLASARAMK
jgi:photosystem II stability/assembly factor-like uncharacterized protein